MNLRTALPWLLAALFAICLPLAFRHSFALSLLSQMGIAMIFALSYNMLLGQTGMLSFGHAVYYGLGAYLCIHALNLIGKGSIVFPVTLVPLLGGLAGVVFGIVFGYVTTQRSGTPFAMISLGIGELVTACSLMFPIFFGGEGGIAANRTVGGKWLGISYGPQIQVYYLIAAWLLISVALMLFISRTPLGRMANAVRDNPERVQFVGYNPQRVRFLMLILAGFFAGIAGGLSAINYELVTSEAVSAQTSGSVLLMTFIGGIGHFAGPIVGAVLVTFLQVALSGYTKAWLLYFGLFFLVMVLYAPEGIVGVVMRHRPLWQSRLLGRVIPAYLLALVPLAVALLGVIGLIELTYQIESDAGPAGWHPLGIAIDPRSALPWIAAAVLLCVGGAAFVRVGRSAARSFENANVELARQNA